MYKENGIDHIVNLPSEFFNSLNFDADSLRKYRVNAAKKCAETLGKNPALLFSGGVDSQTMVQCFVEAEIDVNIITFVFNENLNIQDSNYAKFFCKMNNLKHIEYEFDILNFLQSENFQIGLKYKSKSPHFNAHYKMAEILKDKGYTGVCCGGFTPTLVNGNWGTNYGYNTCQYIHVSDILGINFQGNFLSYTPELCWSISLLSEKIEIEDLEDLSFKNLKNSTKIRYDKKIKGYTRHGFNIFPQPQKFTGFELLKKYYEKKTQDGWFFEKSFRMPLLQHFKNIDQKIYKMNLSVLQQNQLLTIYSKNFASAETSTSGIS